jgi:hypothetical protein
MGTITLTHRKLEQKDVIQFLDISKRALHERGMVSTNFDESTHNLHVKNVLSTPFNNHGFGLFDGNELVGFIFGEVNFELWMNDQQFVIEIIHIKPEHRTFDNYVKLVNIIEDFCIDNDITQISTVGHTFLMDNDNQCLAALNYLRYKPGQTIFEKDI